jgi:putative membrane protein insertion efficiency factor
MTRGVLGLVLMVSVGALALSMSARSIVVASIHVYQHHVSPLAAAAGYRCRFTPTCSRYAEVAIARDGLVKGGWRAVGRLVRCGPWTPMGTRDEP